MSAIAQGAPILSETKRPRSGATTLWIVLTDIVALEVALMLGCLLRLALNPIMLHHIGTAQFAGLSLGILTLPLAYYWVGLYPGYGIGAVQRLRSRVYATLLVFVVLLAWNYTFASGHWSRGVLLSTMLFALVVPPFFESFTRKQLIRAGLCGLPVIILGGSKTGGLVAERLQKQPDLGLIPIGILDDDSTKWGSEIHGIPIAGPISSASLYQQQARAAVIAMPGLDRQRLMRLIEGLSFSSVIVIPDLMGLQTLWSVSRDLGGILGIEVRKNLLIAKNRILKRVLDYAIALPAFVISLPLLGLFALWIKIVSPGPAFFRQEREGEGGKRISVLKLRTMYPNAEKVLRDYLEAHPGQAAIWAKHYKLKKDPRVLPGIGSFLRMASLDELPQIWNVLRGQMSLVGPRPFPYYHLDSFPPAFRKLRHSVAPGITGLWQVSERSDGDLTVQEAQDTYYIRNWSLWLDLYILLKTVRTVLMPRGAY